MESIMFGDKSIFGSSKNAQNMPKKGQKENIFFCPLNKGQLPTLSMSKSFTFYIPLKNLRFLNITENKIFLMKAFL